MRALRSQAWLLTLTTAALLSACATPRPVAVPGEDIWSGRLALQIDGTPPQSFSAAFDLRGAPDAGELQLSTPLGNTLAAVVWTPQSAELRQGSQVTRRGSLDELTSELTGTAVPVAAMFGWLRGVQGDVPGWQADLSRQTQGRVTARRSAPLPTAELRIVFEP